MSIEHINALQLSLRRAGSTTLHRAITAHPYIDGHAEIVSFHTRPGKDGGFDKTDPLSPMNFSSRNHYSEEWLHTGMQAKPAESWTLQHIVSYFNSQSENLSQVCYAKETFANLHLGLLFSLLPQDMRIVYLKRDLRGVISSYKVGNLFNKWHVAKIYNQLSETVLANPELVERYGSIITDAVIGEDSWIDILTRKIIILQSELERHALSSPQCKQVEFHEFIRNTKNVVGELFQWFNVPPFQEVLDHAHVLTHTNSQKKDVMHPLYQQHHPDNWVVLLDQKEQDTIETICDNYGIQLTQVDKNKVLDEIQNKEEQKKEKRAFLYTSPELQSSVSEGRQSIAQEINRNLVYYNRKENTFYLCKYPVTNREFSVYLNWLQSSGLVHNQHRYLFYNPQRGKIKEQDKNWKIKEGYEDYPVVSVTWLGALTFAKWIGGRLPSYEEWKSVYDETTQDLTNVNVDQVCNGPSPIGHFSPQGKMYDLIGNVREWTDTFASDESVYTPGGSWQDSPLAIKTHFSKTGIAALSEIDMGFRLASSSLQLTPEEEDEIKKKIAAVLVFINTKDRIQKPISYIYNKIREIMTNPYLA